MNSSNKISLEQTYYYGTWMLMEQRLQQDWRQVSIAGVTTASGMLNANGDITTLHRHQQ